jgi:Na+-transporting methylmalonyl-CoA/oxaloacetate decarboxylase gamma subunit
MNNALFISLVGMGLVFVGLMALWLMMIILVKVTKEKETTQFIKDDELKLPDFNQELENKRKAASAAVVIAMAISNASLTSCENKEKEAISPWQAAYRTWQASAIPNLPRRKD